MMIENKELRCGNLVYTWDTDYEFGPGNQFLQVVKGIRERVVEFETSHANYDEIMPIPLTTEWLKKLGGSQPYEDQPELWQIGLFIFNLHEVYGLCQWDPEGQCILFATIHYDYVHQIQNLFFALTGGELKIKQ